MQLGANLMPQESAGRILRHSNLSKPKLREEQGSPVCRAQGFLLLRAPWVILSQTPLPKLLLILISIQNNISYPVILSLICLIP